MYIFFFHGHGTSIFQTLIILNVKKMLSKTRGGSRTAATSKIESFVIIVNGWNPLTIITKRSILDVAAALDPPLKRLTKAHCVIGITFHKKVKPISGFWVKSHSYFRVACCNKRELAYCINEIVFLKLTVLNPF